MKWAKIETPKSYSESKLGLEAKQENEKYIEYIKPNTHTPDDLHKLGFGKWFICTEAEDAYIKSFSQSPAARSHYEAFVGGFLYYFENHDSPICDDDRTLLFDWGKIDTTRALTIYLRPLYKPYYTPDGKQIKWNKTRNDSNCGNNIQVIVQRSPLAPPPSGGETDPPPPPSPPPPPRDFQ